MGWSGHFVNGWSKSDMIRDAIELEFRGCEIVGMTVSFTHAWVAYKNTGYSDDVYVTFCLVRTYKDEVLIKTISPYYTDSHGVMSLESVPDCPRKIAALATFERAQQWRELLEARRAKRRQIRKAMRSGQKFDTHNGDQVFFSQPHRQYVVRSARDGKLYKAQDVMDYQYVVA